MLVLTAPFLLSCHRCPRLLALVPSLPPLPFSVPGSCSLPKQPFLPCVPAPCFLSFTSLLCLILGCLFFFSPLDSALSPSFLQPRRLHLLLLPFLQDEPAWWDVLEEQAVLLSCRWFSTILRSLSLLGRCGYFPTEQQFLAVSTLLTASALQDKLKSCALQSPKEGLCLGPVLQRVALL